LPARERPRCTALKNAPVPAAESALRPAAVPAEPPGEAQVDVRTRTHGEAQADLRSDGRLATLSVPAALFIGSTQILPRPRPRPRAAADRAGLFLDPPRPRWPSRSWPPLPCHWRSTPGGGTAGWAAPATVPPNVQEVARRGALD
jgi:hypothetical protein